MAKGEARRAIRKARKATRKDNKAREKAGLPMTPTEFSKRSNALLNKGKKKKKRKNK